jgi:hypothetical protein
VTQTLAQGATVTLDAFYRNGLGQLVDPTSPEVSILNPLGTTVVNLATPTHISLGHYQYSYVIASDATLGAWEARWFGVIDSAQVGPVDDGFTVVLSGSIGGGTPNGLTCSPWATLEDLCSPCDDYGLDPTNLEDGLQAASDILFELSGRRWPGVCHDVIRPQAVWRTDERAGQWWPVTNGAAIERGSWGFCSCNRPRSTGCTRLPEIKLPGAPVDPASVVVKIDGVTYLPADNLFRIDDGKYLVRLDGEGWPCCQDMRADVDDPEAHTFEVAYDYGSLPPIGGVRAAASLGCQLALSTASDASLQGKCRLPKRITSITRQGMTIAVLDPFTVFKDGLTGLADVDLWLSSIRFGAKSRRSAILVPGRNRRSRRAGQ